VLPEPTGDKDPATASDALLPPFHLTWHGYDQHTVDAFFSQIWTVNAEQIAAARFPVRVRGYVMRDVDRALDGWAVRHRGDQPSAPSR
jgi:DivIVA domain-containing protein